MSIIEPKILKGTRDFGPEEMAKRMYVMNKVRGVFERYGYDTIETPVIEYAETILGKYGEEGDKLTYSFEDNGGRQIALRYDQTVPFARFYAMNYGNLPTPFKRYQINRSWRADKPQRGRYREFYQCDVDIIGTDSILAEVEILKVFSDIYKELGLDMGKIKMRINDRGLMDSIMDGVNVPVELRLKVIAAIDKLDKIGEDAVIDILTDLGLQDSQIDEIEKMLDRSGDNASKLERFKGYATAKIAKILELGYQAGLSEDILKFDISLARGLDYYTGMIIEVVYGDESLGSITGGGRYDNLCGSFCKERFSGIGAALGFDRIMVIMEEEGLLENVSLSSQVLVTQFSEDTVEESLRAYDALHTAEINTEIYFDAAKMAKQFKYADRKNIPWVVVIGPDEAAKGVVVLKDMVNGEQEEMTIEQVIERVRT